MKLSFPLSEFYRIYYNSLPLVRKYSGRLRNGKDSQKIHIMPEKEAEKGGAFSRTAF
jgi:hypothetical protein